MSTAERPKTLLVVEDNAILRKGLAAVLREEGFAVVTAANGREALDWLREDPPPDLILLDMLLPVLDGWRFLELLKEGPASVPVIVTTEVANLSPEWAAAHGCAGFLHKPLDVGMLLAEVRRCLPG
jgi:CheY-like chemotaxis protein